MGREAALIGRDAALMGRWPGRRDCRRTLLLTEGRIGECQHGAGRRFVPGSRPVRQRRGAPVPL